MSAIVSIWNTTELGSQYPWQIPSAKLNLLTKTTPKVTNRYHSDGVVMYLKIPKPKASPQHPSRSQRDHHSDLHLGSSQHDTSYLSTIDSSILKLGPVTFHTDINRALGGFTSTDAFPNAVKPILTRDVSFIQRCPFLSVKKLALNSIHDLAALFRKDVSNMTTPVERSWQGLDHEI